MSDKKYIEANDLLKHLPDEPYKGAIRRVLQQAPAADVVEVRHGKWCWVAYDANPKIGNWHCTYCNRIPKSFQKEDFCPNCGAKMDEERK